MTKKLTYKSDRKSERVKPSWLVSVGLLFAFIWLVATFLQKDPKLFALIGGLNILTTIYTRFLMRRRDALELEGGILGFLIVWILAFVFYSHKDIFIEIFGWAVQINEIMIIYLVFAFIAWFLISPKKTTQEIILGLPLFYSNFLLNLWKYAVIFLFLVNLPELHFLSDFAIIFFLICGYFELIIYYVKQYKINYADIILNPVKLLLNVFSGVMQAFKWILLPLLFILLQQLDFDIGTIILIFGAIFIGLIALITSFTRLFISSGVIGSKIDENETLIPKIIEEIQHISTFDQLVQFEEFYEVPMNLYITKLNEVISLNKGDMILHIPFSPTLEEKTGIFIFHLNMRNLKINLQKERSIKKVIVNKEIKEFEEGTKTKIKHFDLKGSAIHRISIKQWMDVKKNLRLIEKETFASLIGFKDSKEFDEELARIVSGTVWLQEQVRSRLRGVPVPSFKNNFTSTIKNNCLILPSKLIEEKNITEGQEIELIKGKNEYLFYVKRRESGF